MSEQAPSYRSDAIYVSWQSRSGLGYVAKAIGTVSDELADTIIADWLKANHPDVVEHMKARHQSDDDFRTALAKKLKVKP